MSYFRNGDPLDDFNRMDREQQKWEDSLPVCDICDKPIQDERYFQKDGENICQQCLEHFMKRNEL